MGAPPNERVKDMYLGNHVVAQCNNGLSLVHMSTSAKRI